jgi:hypothetical protein
MRVMPVGDGYECHRRPGGEHRGRFWDLLFISSRAGARHVRGSDRLAHLVAAQLSAAGTTTSASGPCPGSAVATVAVPSSSPALVVIIHYLPNLTDNYELAKLGQGLSTLVSGR